MATLTPNYNLEKPEASDEFKDFRASYNGNMDIIDQALGEAGANLAEFYDDTATYSVGDYVIYEGILYKCDTAVTVAETFDPTKWTQVAITDEMGGGTSYTEGDGINISPTREISVDTAFTEASTRTNIASGDTLSTIFGKIKKFFSDLKTVAFTGSYTDLTDQPTIPDISTKVSKTGDTMSGALAIVRNDSDTVLYIQGNDPNAVYTRYSDSNNTVLGYFGLKRNSDNNIYADAYFGGLSHYLAYKNDIPATVADITNFNLQENAINWGYQGGTPVNQWNVDGCSFGFRKNCPTGGQLSMVIDGTVYVNEGAEEVATKNFVGQNFLRVFPVGMNGKRYLVIAIPRDRFGTYTRFVFMMYTVAGGAIRAYLCTLQTNNSVISGNTSLMAGTPFQIGASIGEDTIDGVLCAIMEFDFGGNVWDYSYVLSTYDYLKALSR